MPRHYPHFRLLRRHPDKWCPKIPLTQTQAATPRPFLYHHALQRVLPCRINQRRQRAQPAWHRHRPGTRQQCTRQYIAANRITAAAGDRLTVASSLGLLWHCLWACQLHHAAAFIAAAFIVAVAGRVWSCRPCGDADTAFFAHDARPNAAAAASGGSRRAAFGHVIDAPPRATPRSASSPPRTTRSLFTSPSR